MAATMTSMPSARTQQRAAMQSAVALEVISMVNSTCSWERSPGGLELGPSKPGQRLHTCRYTYIYICTYTSIYTYTCVGRLTQTYMNIGHIYLPIEREREGERERQREKHPMPTLSSIVRPGTLLTKSGDCTNMYGNPYNARKNFICTRGSLRTYIYIHKYIYIYVRTHTYISLHIYRCRDIYTYYIYACIRAAGTVHHGTHFR